MLLSCSSLISISSVELDFKLVAHAKLELKKITGLTRILIENFHKTGKIAKVSGCISMNMIRNI